MVFNITKVTVRPESIPAGISLCDELKPSHSVLIVDLGGTTLDISMVAGQMTSVSRIYGDPKLGVSLVTDAVAALARANTDTSSYNVDQIIINRHDEEYLTDNINDPDAVSEVKKVINNSIERLTTRVLTAIDTLKAIRTRSSLAAARWLPTPFVNGWVCARIVSWWLKSRSLPCVV